jgi:GLPGLI family protein
MKNLFLLFVLLINPTIFNNTVKKQSGEITYTVSFNKNVLAKAKSSNNKKLKRLLKNASDIDYRLAFNNEFSRYEKVKSMQNDANSHFNITEVEAGGSSVYYFDNKSKENIYSKTFGNELYLITQKPLHWKLTKTSKTIGDYNCFKAIILNHKNVETAVFAWYAPEIPLSFGPKNFNGLPGLILELNSEKATYIASKIKLSDKTKVIKKPKYGIKLTYEEFKKRFEGFFDEN